MTQKRWTWQCWTCGVVEAVESMAAALAAWVKHDQDKHKANG